MKTYNINGLKAYNYNESDTPQPNATRIAALDPAFGESESIGLEATAVIKDGAVRSITLTNPGPPSPDEMDTKHKATYCEENFKRIEMDIAKCRTQIAKLKREAYSVAEQMLYEHETPYYAYCASGSGGVWPLTPAAKYEWDARRELLTQRVRWFNPQPPVVTSTKNPSWWARGFGWLAGT